jgi:hypothetical protein
MYAQMTTSQSLQPEQPKSLNLAVADGIVLDNDDDDNDAAADDDDDEEKIRIQTSAPLNINGIRSRLLTKSDVTCLSILMGHAVA